MNIFLETLKALTCRSHTLLRRLNDIILLAILVQWTNPKCINLPLHTQYIHPWMNIMTYNILFVLYSYRRPRQTGQRGRPSVPQHTTSITHTVCNMYVCMYSTPSPTLLISFATLSLLLPIHNPGGKSFPVYISILCRILILLVAVSPASPCSVFFFFFLI